MTAKLSKTEVKKLLISERKSMREKQKQSLFMRRTLSIYNGMKKRAAENGAMLDFDIEWLRGFVHRRVGSPCAYCPAILSVATLCLDHPDPIARGGSFRYGNLFVCCKPCNFQKGILNAGEFRNLLKILDTQMDSEAAADVKRRLTIGGRWSWK